MYSERAVCRSVWLAKGLPGACALRAASVADLARQVLKLMALACKGLVFMVHMCWVG